MFKKSSLYTIKTQHFEVINYCYILIDNYSKECVVIDPAWNMELFEQAINNVKGKLKYVLLTHSHFDHTNLANEMANRYGAIVCMSQKEINDYNFVCNNLMAVTDEKKLLIGETEIECILTPGHTSGSLCYYSDNKLFTGDTIFIEGCGMCNLPGGSPYDMYYSVNKIKEKMNAETRIFPAHCYGKKVGCTMEEMMKYNLYFYLDNIDQFVDFRMRKGKRGLFDFK